MLCDNIELLDFYNGTIENPIKFPTGYSKKSNRLAEKMICKTSDLLFVTAFEWFKDIIFIAWSVSTFIIKYHIKYNDLDFINEHTLLYYLDDYIFLTCKLSHILINHNNGEVIMIQRIKEKEKYHSRSFSLSPCFILCVDDDNTIYIKG